MTAQPLSTAMVTHREFVCDDGGATIHGVRLADGFVIETGSGYFAQARARFLAEAVNAFGADKFTTDSLAGDCPF